MQDTHIFGLYLAPPDHALVLCVDEKSPIKALDQTAPLLPMRPGKIKRRTHDQVHHGITTRCGTARCFTKTATAC
jgi:hypothetical protein